MNKYYGQFDPPVDQFIYERYFQHKESPGFFVECGAFDGETECSCKFFEETLHWKGMNIEPGRPIFDKLVINRPDSININVALSNRNGAATLHHVIHPMFGEFCTNSSLEHTEEHKQTLKMMQCEILEYQVSTMTFRTLVNKYRIKNIDLMVLDVEGLELKVIEGMWQSACLPKILCVEYPHVGKDAVTDALSLFGYEYDTSSFVNAFYVLQQSQCVFPYEFRRIKSFFHSTKINLLNKCRTTETKG